MLLGSAEKVSFLRFFFHLRRTLESLTLFVCFYSLGKGIRARVREEGEELCYEPHGRSLLSHDCEARKLKKTWR